MAKKKIKKKVLVKKTHVVSQSHPKGVLLLVGAIVAIVAVLATTLFIRNSKLEVVYQDAVGSSK